MLLDIALGIFAAIVTGEIFSVPVGWSMVLGGIFFAVLPDLDFILVYLTKGRSRVMYEDAYQHRIFPHKPLVFIPLGMAAISFFSLSWAILFGLGIFFHLLHDSIGIGRGIQWLYPFSKKHFVFLYFYTPVKNKKVPGKKFGVYVWDPKLLSEIDREFGDPNWIENVYKKWHPYAIFELIGFLIGVLSLVYVMLK